MWADERDTMIIPSPNKRVEKLDPGKTYWCSSAVFGLKKVFLIGINETHAMVTLNGPDEISIRLSESTFFYEQPVRR